MDSLVENPMMPEQQSLMLYIVVGRGSKNGSRLPKTAPGAVSKVRLYGSSATCKKTAPGSQKWLGKPPLRCCSGAAPMTCLFFAVEFAGWDLASGAYSWKLASCVWPPSYQFP